MASFQLGLTRELRGLDQFNFYRHCMRRMLSILEGHTKRVVDQHSGSQGAGRFHPELPHVIG